MTVEGEKFIAEMLRGLRAEMSDMRRDLTALTLRQNATEHFEQGMMGHFASMHAALDSLRADMRQVRTRLELSDD